MTRTGSPYPGARAPRPDRRRFRSARVPGRRTRSPAGSTAGDLVPRVRQRRRAASATSWCSRLGVGRSRVVEGDRRPGAFLPHGLPRPRGARRASSSTCAREVYDKRYREILDSLLADGSLRAAWAPRAVHAERTSRVPGRAARAHGRGRDARPGPVPAAPEAEQRSAADSGDRARPRADRGVHVRSGVRPDRGGTAARASGDRPAPAARARYLNAVATRPRRLALLHCVMCHHGAATAPGGRFGSAEALALYPGQRTRRVCQGRARARCARLFPRGNRVAVTSAFGEADRRASHRGCAGCRARGRLRCRA